MKILIFTGYFHPHKGGVEKFVLEISKSLIEKGHEITVVCANSNKVKEKEEYEKIKIYRLSSINWIEGFPIIYSKKIIAEELQKEKFDVVITNTRFFHTSLIGGKFAKKKRIPWIHFEHGSTFVQTKNPLIWLGSRMYDYTLGKWIFKNADKIVSPSERSKHFVKKLMNRDIKVIRYGIDTKNIKKIRPKKEIKNLIYVGRLTYGKGIQDLLVAFSQLRNKKLNLTIVGDGPFRKNLEMLSKKLNIAKRVKFVGNKDKKEVMKFYSNSDIFINPSYSEGLPNTVIEAGATGLAVIATDVGGTEEIIINKKTGLLIKEKDPKEIKKAIEFMLNNPQERISYQKNIQEQIKKNFDWKEVVSNWENLLKNIKR